MITKCPFPCIVKSNYGICVAGRCMNYEYQNLWNGDNLDAQKMKRYQGQTKPLKEEETK